MSPVGRLTAARPQTAIHGKNHARDESGIRPGEEGDHVGDLLRLGGASKRYASDELGDIVGRDVGGGVGCREGGGNRIDSDTSRCQLRA